jgi:hypothetical protein
MRWQGLLREDGRAGEAGSRNTHRVAGEGNSGNENADAAPRQAGLTYSIALGEGHGAVIKARGSSREHYAWAAS